MMGNRRIGLQHSRKMTKQRPLRQFTLSLLFAILTSAGHWRLLFLLDFVCSFVPSDKAKSIDYHKTICAVRGRFDRRFQTKERLCLSTTASSEPNNDLADTNETPVATTTTTESSTTGDSSSSSCPFSKTFPRYQIDLTTRATKGQNSEFIFSRITSPFRTFQKSMQNSQLEQQLRDKTGNDRLVIQSELDGVAALAFLWEQAAQLIDSQVKYVDGSNSKCSAALIIALPDASPLLVRNFVEILQWLVMLPDDDPSGNKSAAPALLSASLVDTKGLNVPVLRLEYINIQDRKMLEDKENKISHSDDEKIVNTRTRKWVRRILVKQGICPFTKSDRMSGQGLADLGVPVGSIAYHASFQTHAVGLFADTWKAIHQMIQAGPSGKDGVSSILLAAPAFDGDFDYWAGPLFAMLEASVVAVQAEAEIGVVCFHPKYATPDGKSWPGFGHMHSVPRLEKWYKEYEDTVTAAKGTPIALSGLCTEQIAAGGAWQRRTPHATINVLRAKQLELAESRRESAKMYTENIEKLVGIDGIGSDQLALDLEMERQSRSW